MTYESNNSTIGKNIFTFHMSIVSGNIQNRQEKKRKKMDKAFVDLNLVLYGTFSAAILKFQLFLNFIKISVVCTRHGRHLISQTIMVMGSDWIGRGISYYKYNSSLGRTFMSETWVSILLKLISTTIPV